VSTALAKRAIGSITRYSGPHSVVVPVKVLTAPAERPVYLLEDGSFKVVSAARSVGGTVTFEKVKAGKWLVLGIDDTAQYNAVVVDRVVTG
jgi:hypothetical protein